MTWNCKSKLDDLVDLLEDIKNQMELIKSAICYVNAKINRVSTVLPLYDDGCFDEDELHG